MSDVSTASPNQPTTSANHVPLALVALALGGFAIGTTEFVTMGLLSQIADGIGESIPRTGHLISAYAFGVVVGAPIIVSLAARLPLKALTIALVLAVGIGSAVTAVSSGYWAMMGARFIAGLPHGAYFGVASLVAASMVPANRRGRAIGWVMLGLSVATVAGVPIATFMGQQIGWRSAYWLVLAVAVAAAVLQASFLPHIPGNPEATVRGELAALRRPQVLFAAATGMIGFGGVFAMYSYIDPLVTEVAGLRLGVIPWVLLAFGVCSVAGTYLAGVLSDWNVTRSILGGFVTTAVVLAVFAATAQIAVMVFAGSFVVGLLGSVMAVGLQVRLMDVAGEARMLGAALNHSALNVANGLGAWIGSVVITLGWGYRAPSLVGAGLSMVGVVVFSAGLVQARRARSTMRGSDVAAEL